MYKRWSMLRRTGRPSMCGAKAASYRAGCVKYALVNRPAFNVHSSPTCQTASCLSSALRPYPQHRLCMRGVVGASGHCMLLTLSTICLDCLAAY